MKFSQPSSARKINTYRVLNILRKEENLSKAEISRRLSLNKVSTGEIVNDLITDGIVKESGKIISSNGRKPTLLELDYKSKFVIAVDIGPRNTTVSLLDLATEIIKLERIPNVIDQNQEVFCVNIIKSCLRTIKPVKKEQIIGIGVTCQGEISEDRLTIKSCSYLPWTDIMLGEILSKVLNFPVVIKNSLEALVMAENQKKEVFEKETLYIDWGDRINCILVHKGVVFGLNSNFGHLKVADRGLCFCGAIGCLESQVSAWALSNNINDRLKNLWEKINKDSLDCLLLAFESAEKITGCKQIFIGGEGSTIPNKKLEYLRSKSIIPIYCSSLGEKSNILSAAEAGLDEFLFQSKLLAEVCNWI